MNHFVQSRRIRLRTIIVFNVFNHVPLSPSSTPEARDLHEASNFVLPMNTSIFAGWFGLSIRNYFLSIPSKLTNPLSPYYIIQPFLLNGRA